MRVPVLLLLTALSLSSCRQLRGIDEHGRTRLMRAAESGDLAQVRRLARKSTVNDQVEDHSALRYFIAFISWMQQLPERKAGWTPLMFAVEQRHAAVVEELLREGADPNLGSDITKPLQLAVTPRGVDRALVTTLLRAGASPNHGFPAPIEVATSVGDTSLIKQLLAAGAQMDAPRREPLIVAAVLGRKVGAVKVLLEAGANPNARDLRTRRPALALALERGNDSIAQLLIAAGADRQAEKDEALQNAIKAGDVAEVRRLIAGGADVNAPDESGRSLIFHALGARNEQLAFVLLEAGAQIPAPARGPMLYTAAVTGADSLVALLLQGMKPEPHHLGAAAAGGTVRTVEMMLAAGADPKSPEALRNAVRTDNAVVLERLIGAGADANTQLRGETLLDYAVRGRALKSTVVLLAAGADARAPRSQPLLYTPIVYADTVTALRLLEHGADINARDEQGRTVLDHATRLNKPEWVLAFLRRHGAQ